MRIVGFGGEEDEGRHEQEQLGFIEQLVNVEIKRANEFVQELKTEFRAVEDLLHNLEKTAQQLKVLEKIFGNRQELLRHLSIQEINHFPNPKYAQNLLRGINQLDYEIRPMIEAIHRVIGNHLLNGTHELYRQSEENRTRLGVIDGEFRKIGVRVIEISMEIIMYEWPEGK